MKTTTLSVVVAAFLVNTAEAQINESPPRSATATAPTRNIGSASSETGSILKKSIKWSSKIPVNKTYGELDEKQLADFRSLYKDLAPGDEPPFPEEGLKSIFYKIRNAQRLRQSRGELNMKVTVGADGKAVKVEDFGSVRDLEMTQFVSSLLMLTKYKPAVCSGKPCEMQFPFDLKLF